MISPIVVGRCYVGQGGDVRYPVCIAAVGSGYTVVWDSVPYDSAYYGGNLIAERAKRPHGALAMKKFERWAVAEYRSP